MLALLAVFPNTSTAHPYALPLSWPIILCPIKGLCCHFPAFFSFSGTSFSFRHCISSSRSDPAFAHTSERGLWPLSLPHSLWLYEQCCVSAEKLSSVQCCSPHIIATRAGGTVTWWISTDFVSVLLTVERTKSKDNWDPSVLNSLTCISCKHTQISDSRNRSHIFTGDHLRHELYFVFLWFAK